jgi:hypothetical protein
MTMTLCKDCHDSCPKYSEYDQQRREAEKQCEQLAMEGMMKK